MLVPVCMLVALVSLGQAAPIGYLLNTPEVRQAKEEFFRIFDKALNGMIETVFLGDSQDVKEYKEKFFKTYNSAMTDLFVTVDGIYTPEQVSARKQFHQAYKDTKSGKIGAQYLEDTQEVKEAKARFFKFFQFVLDGMLYKLVPKPSHNVIPEEIADFYIKDDPEVAAEKLKFDQLYRNALKGDAASAIAVVALENAISNNPGEMNAAVKDLDDTLNAIADAVDDEYNDNNDSDDDDYDDKDAVDNEYTDSNTDDDDDDSVELDIGDGDGQDEDYGIDDTDDENSSEEEGLTNEEEKEDNDSSLFNEENTEDS